MTSPDGFDVFINGFLACVRKVILEDWNPGSLRSEREYQESLFSYLQQALPDCIVRKDYPEAGALVDIHIKRKSMFGDDEAFLELKHDLSDKPEFNRLVGQLMDLEPQKRRILVVLCGQTERSIVQRLQGHFQDHLSEDFFGPRMAIVVKPLATT